MGLRLNRTWRFLSCFYSRDNYFAITRRGRQPRRHCHIRVAIADDYDAILVNCAFDQTRCAADQFINCAAVYELRNIWSTAQRNCNRVGIRVRSRVRARARVWVRISFRVRVRVRLAQLAKCAARVVKRAARFVKHADWPNAPYYANTWVALSLF